MTKSFCCLGKSLDKCFNCKYCRAKPICTENEYSILPETINPIFSNIPIVINMFYGDPVLQIENTKKYLSKLERVKHKGIVLIITKGNITEFGNLNYDLDLHIALSTIGITHNVDKIGYKNFLNNINHIHKYNTKFSCEFRPIMYGINDNKEVISNLFKICSDNNLSIGYCGLQGSPELLKYWKDNNIQDFKAFPNYELCMKKPISDNCMNFINEYSNKYNVPVFKKTSCLLSYVHNLDRDYNAHYYRPNELGCANCIMSSKCNKFKNNQNDKIDFNDIIPFENTIKKINNYKCMYHDVCKYPHSDCTNMNGYVIHIDKKITRSDIRIIKWLTGYTVEAEFEETPYISKDWYK